MDAKNLLKFLASYTIAGTTIACALRYMPWLELSDPESSGICADHCAIFYVYIGDSRDSLQGGVLTFFIPCVRKDGDDD